MSPQPPSTHPRAIARARARTAFACRCVSPLPCAMCAQVCGVRAALALALQASTGTLVWRATSDAARCGSRRGSCTHPREGELCL